MSILDPNLFVSMTGALLVAATILPLVVTRKWWIRFCDFPRLQIAAAIAAVLVIAAFVLDFSEWPSWLLVGALALAGAEQARRIFPFTPLKPVQVMDAGACDSLARLSVLIANILIANRKSELLIDMVRRAEPDLLLVLETDAWWDAQLSVLAKDYPYLVRHPQDDGYGMHLFSKLELIDPELRFLLDENIPSIHCGVRLRSGAAIAFHGVHPQPPDVGQDTAERDAELVIVGRLVRQDPRPAIVAGDLNDVAWSRTNQVFHKVSGLLDPRIGRGVFATFHADWPLLRWPLDHVFTDPRFTIVSLRRMDHIGSDHFPIFVELCLAPQAAEAHAAPQPSAEDLKRAREAVHEGREEAREESLAP